MQFSKNPFGWWYFTGMNYNKQFKAVSTAPSMGSLGLWLGLLDPTATHVTVHITIGNLSSVSPIPDVNSWLLTFGFQLHNVIPGYPKPDMDAMEPSYELIHTQMKTQEWDNSKVIHATSFSIVDICVTLLSIASGCNAHCKNKYQSALADSPRSQPGSRCSASHRSNEMWLLDNHIQSSLPRVGPFWWFSKINQWFSFLQNAVLP